MIGRVPSSMDLTPQSANDRPGSRGAMVPHGARSGGADRLPGWKRVGQAAPRIRIEPRLADEAGVEGGPDRGLVHAGADEDEFLPPVAPDVVVVSGKNAPPPGIVGPAMPRNGGPPAAQRCRPR